MEREFGEIPDHLKLSGERERDERIAKVFFMACYDLDRFRDFLTDNSSLPEEMQLNEEALERL
ncbi:hypothetical protein CEB3_c37730 [Peptococcaceae bacterium CEB3]|nr:hypothetical protein CEB3_c37730 [Peptococcaceae bacterium CEB3]